MTRPTRHRAVWLIVGLILGGALVLAYQSPFVRGFLRGSTDSSPPSAPSGSVPEAPGPDNRITSMPPQPAAQPTDGAEDPRENE